MTEPVPDVVELLGVRSLHGEVRPPGDKSISHRSVLLGALGAGRSTVVGLSDGEDVARTVACVTALGAVAHREPDGMLEIEGGRDRLVATDEVLQCGNSGTTMRLLAGVAASIDGVHRLDGDVSLRHRPMDRVAVPLERMGARLHGRGEACAPPVTVTGSRHLRAVRYELPVASAQVKSAVLLAGLVGDGPTTVIEPVRTRAYTESMLAHARARVEVTAHPDGRHTTVWPSEVTPRDWHVPGDPSQAAFLVVAGLLCERAEVFVRDVELSEERRGFVDVLSRMDAHLIIRFGRDDVGDVVAVPATLAATTVAAAEVPSLDEVPVLAVAAAAATGTTTFLDVAELRVKESDRLAATVALVHALGAEATVVGDALSVTGVGTAARFQRLEFDARGDHRMAMAAAVAAMVGQGGVVAGFSGVATSYPSFLADLASLR